MKRLLSLALFGALALSLTVPAQENQVDLLREAQAQLLVQQAQLAELESAFALSSVELKTAESQLEMLDAQSPPTTIARIEARRSDLRIEHAELEVRRAVMEEKILELSAETLHAIESDSLVARLRDLLKVLDSRYAPENYADPNHQEAIEGRMRAIELAVGLEARKDLLRERSGGGLVQGLRERLLEVDIELAVMKARRLALEEERERTLAVEVERRQQRAEHGRRQSLAHEKRDAMNSEARALSELKNRLEALRALGYVDDSLDDDR